MKTSDFIIIHRPTSEEKMEALKAFLKALKIKFEVPKKDDFEIPDSHKKVVRERIKKSKTDELLDWDKVKNNFNGI